MDDAKKMKLGGISVFLFLVLFPFGQVISLPVALGGWHFRIHPIDLVALLCLLPALVSRQFTSGQKALFSPFASVLAFSFFLSVFFHPIGQLVEGFFYLLRLAAYFAFFGVVLDFAARRKGSALLLRDGLLSVGFFTAVFGWVQYFFFPDFRSFTVWGWDDHLYRLIGTFMDPGFTGIILVLSAVLALYSFFRNSRSIHGLLFIFFSVSVLFTYSRASFIALLAGVLVLLYFFRKARLFLLCLAVFVIAVLSLPRPAGEGVKLERTSSIHTRITSYSEGFGVFLQNPVFGVGYNNICLVKKVGLGETDTASHSCSGFESGILTLLAATGLAGFFAFIHLLWGLARSIAGASLRALFVSSVLAVLAHSFFVNSLFYPWVMGWMAVIYSLGAGIRGKTSG